MMDAPTRTAAADDLSALAWVHGELRRTLEAAQKALRRHLKESGALAGLGGSDVDAIDPAVLRGARAQLHQGAAALEMVNLVVPARVLRAAEAAVQRLVAKPRLVNAIAVETVEGACFALLDYLARLLAGKPVSSLALFPQYRAAQQLAGAERIHPADLWDPAWQWRTLPAEPMPPRAPDDAARGELEGLVLASMRGHDPIALQAMSELAAALAEGQRPHDPQASTLWQMAAAFFEAQAAGLLVGDVYGKRVASRLLTLLRSHARSGDEAATQLAQDLLFFCAHAHAPSELRVAPRLAALRAAWPMPDISGVDYETVRLGRFDPALLAQARKRIGAAREAWSTVAAGEQHRLASLAEQFALVGDSLQRLYPEGAALAQALEGATARVVADGGEASGSLAMEVATAVLYLEASLDDGELDHPDLGPRVRRLAERVARAEAGAVPDALDPWMEELYRRVSDRQTLGSVVHELRASLSEAEKQIDQYFRNPALRDLLIPVPTLLSSMRGVLSVLGLEQASQAVLHMRDEVDALAQADADPAGAAGTFARLAENLGALSFLIDMLGVQPALAHRVFRFDAERGRLVSELGDRRRSVADLPAIDPEPEPEPEPLAATPAEREPLAIASVATAEAPTAPPDAPADGLDDEDAEMRGIFIEEAREVLAEAAASMDRLAAVPDDAAELATVRRAFHTLKGSSRMVGLADFGDGAWALENLCNARLASASPMDADWAGLTRSALAYLGDWVEAIEARRSGGHGAAALVAAADALRLEGRCVEVVRPGEACAAGAGAAEPDGDAVTRDAGWAVETAGAPEVIALDLALPEPVHGISLGAGPDAGPMAIPSAEAYAEPTGLDFELDLSGLGAMPAVDLPSFPAEVAAPTAPSADAAPFVDLDLSFGDAAVPAPEPQPAAAGADDEPLAAGAVTECWAGVDGLAGLDTLEAPADGSPAPVPALMGGQDAFAAIDLSGLDALPAAAAWDVAGQVADEPVAEAPATADGIPGASAADATAARPASADDVRQVGPLRIGTPLFDIYLQEAEGLSRRLDEALEAWAWEPWQPVGEEAIALAHSLGGSSSTVGYAELSGLARRLEHALMRSRAGGGAAPGEPELFAAVAAEIRRLLHQFAAGFLPPASPELLARLEAHERDTPAPAADPSQATELGAFDASLPPPASAPAGAVSAGDDAPAAAMAGEPVAAPVDAPVTASVAPAAVAPRPAAPDWAASLEDDEGIEAVDAVDPELFPIFDEEAGELLAELPRRLAAWAAQPSGAAPPQACLRTLHTFKGGARLAGAMRLGELAHRLETAIERLAATEAATPADVERLVARADAMAAQFDALRQGSAVAGEPSGPGFAESRFECPLDAPPGEPPGPAGRHGPDLTPASLDLAHAPSPHAGDGEAPDAIDWQRFADDGARVAPEVAPAAPAPERRSSTGAVRVRAALLDRLVNHAGEVSITRARLHGGVQQMQASLSELTDNLERLRRQLRELELQAETQISSRLEQAKASQEQFDPLEMDRFTRFQEVTRMMAESVNDVATVQRSLQRSLQGSEDELAAQARLTRALQDDLLRTRMLEFESLADRLYRVVRQAAKDSGKQVRLDIEGGAIEVDRGVLDRMAGPFEHLLRNAVAHGIEPPALRAAIGKGAQGLVTVSVRQEGNEVGVEIADDGAGLDLARIRERGIARGLIAPDATTSDAELAQLIFLPGFSTAESVTELAGRGIGMDVVRSEVVAMGGRIETASEPGRGTRMRLVLPLTTAVTQVVMLRCGELTVAVPATLVEVVRRVDVDELAPAHERGTLVYGDEALPLFWLGALLGDAPRSSSAERAQPVVIVRSAAQRVAVHVDEVVGNQEVVVKNLGPQLSRLPGLAGMTLLPSGAVALIYNPVALAALYGPGVRERAARPPVVEPEAAVGDAEPPLIMVVDDSLTVRRVTQRLLQREGYRVVLAKDGLDALDKLAGERPAMLLSDIEMPRMDGFDLVRHVRADARLAELPVVMITSRIAAKHREHAHALGVNHYLGKPYGEEELLALVARHAAGAGRG